MPRRPRLVAPAFLAAALLALGCSRTGLDSGGANGSAPLLVVGGESVGLAEFRDWLSARPGAERRVIRPGGAESELTYLAELMLVERELERRGASADPVYIREREAIRGRARRQERELARTSLLRRLTATVELDDESLYAYYEASRARFVTSRIRLRQIAVRDRETSFKLKADLDQGADFSELASQWNFEPELRVRRGDLGWLFRSDVPADLASAAFLLSTRDEVGDPFQANGVWNLLQLVARENSVQRSFESARPQLEIELRRSLAAEAYNDLIEVLRTDSGVQINGELLAEVGPPAPRRMPPRPPRRPPSAPIPDVGSSGRARGGH